MKERKEKRRRAISRLGAHFPSLKHLSGRPANRPDQNTDGGEITTESSSNNKKGAYNKHGGGESPIGPPHSQSGNDFPITSPLNSSNARGHSRPLPSEFTWPGRNHHLLLLLAAERNRRLRARVSSFLCPSGTNAAAAQRGNYVGGGEGAKSEASLLCLRSVSPNSRRDAQSNAALFRF